MLFGLEFPVCMDDELERENFCVRSTVRTDLLNSTLKRGAWLGGGGAILIILGGTVLPLALLKIWGIPVFGLGIFFISIGLLPYRQLTRLQMKPHAIQCDGNYLLFLKSGKPLFKIALGSLEKARYLEKERQYGIGLWLKRPLYEKVKVLQPHFDFAAFATQSMQDFEGCDLFLPYFSEYAYRSIKDLLEPDRAS